MSSGSTVNLFASILSGKGLPIVPFEVKHEHDIELEPGQQIAITWSTPKNSNGRNGQKKIAIRNLILYYRSPENPGEICSWLFGHYNQRQFDSGLHITHIRKALAHLGIDIPGHFPL